MRKIGFQPSTTRVHGVYTVPSKYKVSYTQPKRVQAGSGLILAGSGPTIQSIVAQEMLKQEGQGIVVSDTSYLSSAPHSGHSSGGSLKLAGGALGPAGSGSGGALRLAGQRMSKGCGFVPDDTLPGQLLKAKLAKAVKKKTPGRAARMPGSGMPDLHSAAKKLLHDDILPALHEALELPVLKQATYKKIVDSVKSKVTDAKSIKPFTDELSKKHLPVLIKMHRKKKGGSGIFDPVEGDLDPNKTKAGNAYLRLTEPLSKYVAAALKHLIKSFASRRQEGGRLVKDPAKRAKIKAFFKDFSKGFFGVLSPAAEYLGGPALTALGVPPPIASGIAKLTSQGLKGANTLIQST